MLKSEKGISTEFSGSLFSGRPGSELHSLVPDCGPELKWKSIMLEVNPWFLDETGDLIFLLKLPGGQIVDSNRSASTTLGYIASELYGKTIFDILHSTFPEGLSWIASGAVSPDRSEVIEAIFQRKSASELPVVIKTRKISPDLAVLMALPIQKVAGTEEALIRSGPKLRHSNDILISQKDKKEKLAKQLDELKNDLGTVVSKLTIELAEEGKKFTEEIRDRIDQLLTTLASAPNGLSQCESEEC